MTDISARLREHASHQVGDAFKTCREAADEIERLRAAAASQWTRQEVRPNPAATALLRQAMEALDQFLDDMGPDGYCVCEEAKQQGVTALAALRGRLGEQT